MNATKERMPSIDVSIEQRLAWDRALRSLAQNPIIDEESRACFCIELGLDGILGLRGEAKEEVRNVVFMLTGTGFFNQPHAMANFLMAMGRSPAN